MILCLLGKKGKSFSAKVRVYHKTEYYPVLSARILLGSQKRRVANVNWNWFASICIIYIKGNNCAALRCAAGGQYKIPTLSKEEYHGDLPKLQHKRHLTMTRCSARKEGQAQFTH